MTFKLNNWYFGNLLFGGVVGMLVVDPLTGAMWKIADPLVDEKLERPTASIAPVLKIMNLADVPEEIKTRLVKLD